MNRAAAVVCAVLLAAPAARAAGTSAVATPQRTIAIAEDQRRWRDGELKSFIWSPTAAVRARAALAIGRLQDSTAVDALIPLLDDVSRDVRREAVFALGQIGSREARPSLQAQLGDADVEVVRLALEALGKIGDKGATGAVVEFLDGRLPRLRGEAAVALWRLADTSAVGRLLPHLADIDADVRWRTVYALEKLPMPAIIVPRALPLLTDPNALVRAHAARTLGRMKSPAATRGLVAAVADSDAAVRINAIRALQGIADSASAEILPVLSGALADRDPYVRVTAATALAEPFAWRSAGTVDAGAAHTALVRGSTDPDAATRGACLRARAMRFGEWALVEDPSPYVRTAQLDGLRGIAQRRPAAMTGAFAPAAVLLGELAPARPLLVRMTAAEVAGTVHPAKDPGTPALLAALRAGLEDGNPLYAASCAGALGDWGDKESVRRLAAAYAARGKDAEPDARQAIRDALRQLATRAFADSVERANPAPPLPSVYPPFFEQDPKEKRAIVHTTAGDIEWELLGRDAPQTVRNFVLLARRKYFDGSCYHRVVPDFVIQDGDPTGTGSGGPGWTIRCEYNRLQYDAGMVGMALSGKDTGGSQWFITLSPQPHLNGRYTIFARVTKGLDVARRVTQGTVIRSIEILP